MKHVIKVLGTPVTQHETQMVEQHNSLQLMTERILREMREDTTEYMHGTHVHRIAVCVSSDKVFYLQPANGRDQELAKKVCERLCAILDDFKHVSGNCSKGRTCGTPTPPQGCVDTPGAAPDDDQCCGDDDCSNDDCNNGKCEEGCDCDCHEGE